MVATAVGGHELVPSLIMVGGPTGIGKSKLVEKLVEYFPQVYRRPTCYSTRAPRQNESGEYVFVSEEELRARLATGALLNFDHVYGSYYAIDRSSVEQLLDCGLCPIKEVHPENHSAIGASIHNVMTILLLPEKETGTAYTHEAAWRDSERKRRSQEDGEYYSRLDPLNFDIARFVGPSPSFDRLADEVDVAVRNHLTHIHEFPQPKIIDVTNRTGYAAVAREFEDDLRPTTAEFHSLSRVFLQQALADCLHEGGKCLEIGAGRGWLRETLAWPNCEYSAVDITAEMFGAEDTSGLLSRTPQEVASARILPFQSRSFDVIVASLADPFFYPLALTEISRVLASKGRFIFTLPTKAWSSAIRRLDRSQETRFQLKSGESASVFSFTFEDYELGALLSSSGLPLQSLSILYGGTPIGGEAKRAPAIESAAERLGLPVARLPVLHAGVSSRGEGRRK